MRNMLAAAFVVVVTSAPAVVQAQSFELGVKGGVVFATLPALERNTEVGSFMNVSSITSVAVGGSFAFGVTDKLAVQPEVLFVQKGYHAEFVEDLFSIDEEFRNGLNYLAVPVLVRLGATGGGFQFLAGPSINFSLEDWDYVEPVDIGVIIGAGYYGRVVTVEGRYEEGLRDTRLPLADVQSLRNRAFLVLFGVRRR